MAGHTYTERVIVLRKTKLGESDLILTLLAQDGAQIRAVAKGARKPTNTFASRLELYSIAEVLCSQGRNLDIIKEARLIEANEHLRSEVEYAVGAAPAAELLDRISQLGLENPRLFAMTQVAFSVMAQVDVVAIPSITAAHLLKTLALAGLRPSFDQCVECGTPIDLNEVSSLVHLSHREGGAFCENCGLHVESILVSAEVVKWAQFLLMTSFEDIAREQMQSKAAFEVLQFCRMWIREHVGSNLKSLDFLFTCGLYEAT